MGVQLFLCCNLQQLEMNRVLWDLTHKYEETVVIFISEVKRYMLLSATIKGFRASNSRESAGDARVELTGEVWTGM